MNHKELRKQRADLTLAIFRLEMALKIKPVPYESAVILGDLHEEYSNKLAQIETLLEERS